MLTIPTPTNPPPSFANPLGNLPRARDKDDADPSANWRIKPIRRFSTTPRSQPPEMTHRHLPVPPPSILLGPGPQVCGASGGFGSFVAVPPFLEPLSSPGPPSTSLSSSHLSEPPSGPEHKPTAATTITTESMMRAR
jgi:hypothetical protein